MGITVSADLLGDAPTGALPEGVYLETDYPEGKVLPDGWTELFRVNGRVYGIRTHVNPNVVFRLMRSIRKGGSMEVAMSELMYELLGDEVMDVLADEAMDDKELDAVMKAVNKHAGGALERVLGNSAQRVGELYWISEYVADVETDMWRFYRLWVDIEHDDFAGLTSARFFEMAERLAGYGGVMTARVSQEQEQQNSLVPQGATVVGSSRAEMMLNPDISDLVDFG